MSAGLAGLAAALLLASCLLAVYVARVFRRFAYPDKAPCFETPEEYDLACEPFEVTTADRVRIAGWLFAPAQARGVVILCHPRSSNKSRMLRQIKLLVDGGMAAVAFDFRACGDSARPARRAFNSMWEPLQDLEAVARFVDQRFAHDPRLLRRIALFGASFGGNMAIAHACTHERSYAALVLDSTPLIRWQDMLGALLVHERRRSRVRGLRALGDRIAIALLVAWTRTEALYQHARRSAQSLAGTPLLLILGERDTFFQIDQSCRFIEENYAGPTRIWRVARGRHLTNHWAEPEQYAARVVSFLYHAFEHAFEESVP